ncbi:MAG: VWA domain-containing protein [Pelovirga sp.]
MFSLDDIVSSSTIRTRRRHSIPSRSGRYLRSEPRQQNNKDRLIAPVATVRSALVRSALTGQTPHLELGDLQYKICQRQGQSLIVFVVDASESMATGARQRMIAARGAIVGLLVGAYQRRDQVALIAFRGERAELLLPPTDSIVLARERLRHLVIGGATPFSGGLQRAQHLIESSQRRDPALLPMLVVVSDGEANVPLTAGADVLDELWQTAAKLAAMEIRSVIVDTSSAVGGSSTLQRLAEQLGGVYQWARDLHPYRLYSMIRALE